MVAGGLLAPGSSLAYVSHGLCPIWGGQLQPRRGHGLPTKGSSEATLGLDGVCRESFTSRVPSS